jgi:hypothetical protein
MIRVERFDDRIIPDAPEPDCDGRMDYDSTGTHLCTLRRGHTSQHRCEANLAHTGTYVWRDGDAEARKL